MQAATGCEQWFLQSQCSFGFCPGAWPVTTPRKCLKNTMARHRMPQFPGSPGAAQENYCTGLRSPPTSKDVSDLCGWSATAEWVLQQGQKPRIQELLQVMQHQLRKGAGTQGITKAAHARIPPDQCNLRFGLLGAGSTLKRWRSPVGCRCVRLHARTTMAPVPPAFAPKLHNLISSCTSQGLPSCHRSTRDQVSASKRVCVRLCKRTSGFQPPSVSPGRGRKSLLLFTA